MEQEDLIAETCMQVRRENPNMSKEELQRTVYDKLGGNLIETALTCSIVMNAHTISRVINLTDRLMASATEQGREKWAYDRNYISKGQVRSVLHGTISRVRDVELKVNMLIDSSGRREAIEDFNELMEDSCSCYDDCIKPVTDALYRYFVCKQVQDGYREDVMMRADVLQVCCLAHVNRELYSYLTRSIPAISCFQEYRILSGWQIQQQMEKLENLLVGDYSVTCKNDKRCIEILMDLSRLVFSTEVLGRVLKARGVEDLVATKKSCIETFEHSTMSLNYYRHHYDAMYRDKDVIALLEKSNRKPKTLKH